MNTDTDQSGPMRPILPLLEILERLNDRETRLLLQFEKHHLSSKGARLVIQRFRILGDVLDAGWANFVRRALVLDQRTFQPDPMQLMMHGLYDRETRRAEVKKSRETMETAKKQYAVAAKFVHEVKFDHRKHFPESALNSGELARRTQTGGKVKNSLFLPGIGGTDIEAIYFMVSASFFSAFIRRVPDSLLVDMGHPIGFCRGKASHILHLQIGDLGAVHGWPTRLEEQGDRPFVQISKLAQLAEWPRVVLKTHCRLYLGGL